MMVALLIFCCVLFVLGIRCSDNIFAPYILVSLVWFSVIFLYLTLDHGFYPIGYRFPMAIFLWVSFFYFSSYLSFKMTVPFSQDKHFVRNIPSEFVIKVYYVLGVLSILFVSYKSIQYALTTDYFFLMLRTLNIGTDEDNSLKFGIISYFLAIGLVLYLIELFRVETLKNKKVAFLLVLNLLFSLITMAKTTFITLFLSTIFVLYIKKKVALKQIILGLLVVFLLSFVLQQLRSHTADGDSGVSDFISLYLVGGVVGFDRVPIEETTNFGEHTFRTFYAIANSLGFDVQVAPVLYEYIEIPQYTNAFTVLYPFYQDFGFIGVVIFAIIQGSFYGFVFKKAITGSVPYTVLYCVSFTFIVFQFMGEYMFVNLSSFVQYFIYVFFPFIYIKLRKDG